MTATPQLAPALRKQQFVDTETREEFWVECCVCSGSELVIEAITGKDALKIMRGKGWRFSRENGGRCPDCVKGRYFP